MARFPVGPMLWFLFLVPLVVAAPIKETVHVGQVYSKKIGFKSTVSLALENSLPDWLLYEDGKLTGIPTQKDIGAHMVSIKTGPAERILELMVLEEDRNPCGEKETFWVEEIHTNAAELATRLKAAERLAEVLEADLSSIRVYDYKYSRQVREIFEDIGSEMEEKDKIRSQFVIIKPSCGGEEDTEGMELAADDLDKLLDYEDEEEESEIFVTITRGRVLPLKQREEVNEDEPEKEEVSTSTLRTTSQRTTRNVYDNAPVRLNSLAAFTCTRGVYCEAVVPESTFKDAEDGDTYSLDLSITLIKGASNWLFYEEKKLRGVPLEDGQYQFRLDARDKKKQMASAPFSVTVKSSAEANHQVVFELDLKESQDIRTMPELLTAFVEQLATVTKSKKEDVCVRDIFKNEDRTVVQWSNNTLSYKKCSESGLESMRHHMLTRHRKQMNRMFERAMTNRFNLRRVDIIPTGNCVAEGTEAVTTVPSVESTQESSFPWIILLAVLAVLFIIAALFVLLCTKNKNKKEKPSEYLGKGLPVVFPEEVGDDQEISHANTPMLTKEERPPLKVSQHENPLYKPPPPLSTGSPRVGSVVSNAPNQRMPPPYVPP